MGGGLLGAVVVVGNEGTCEVEVDFKGVCKVGVGREEVGIVGSDCCCTQSQLEMSVFQYVPGIQEYR